jgi:hypothetical protein
MSDLKVFSVDSSTGAMRLGIPKPGQLVSGIDLLVQLVALAYLNNGGRSISNPGRAGGLRAYIGAYNIDPDDPSELFADIQLMTSRIDEMIKLEQVNTSRPPSERLRSLQLADIVPNEEDLSVEVVVRVVNEEGTATSAVVVTP